MKILVCDDTMFMRATIITQLQKSDPAFEIIEAENGEEAVSKSRKEKPDVVVMDINMPKMDGIEATKLIREKSDTKIIICSCLGNKDHIVSAILAGANDYVIKPVDFKRLIKAVEKTR